jgi:hypothetical protein
MKITCFALLSVLTMSLGAIHAGTIDISLQQPVLAGSPGSVLAFFGTLTNTTDSDVFLNADNFNLSGLPPSSIDDSPFFANTPSGVLGPLGSTGQIELFDITIPSPFAGGVYEGTFQILGGPTAADQIIIGSADFTAQVMTVAPEPSSFWPFWATAGFLGATRIRRLRHARGRLP